MTERFEEPAPTPESLRDQAVLQDIAYAEALQGLDDILTTLGNNEAVVHLLQNRGYLKATPAEIDQEEERLRLNREKLPGLLHNAILTRRNAAVFRHDAERLEATDQN